MPYWQVILHLLRMQHPLNNRSRISTKIQAPVAIQELPVEGEKQTIVVAQAIQADQQL
jgi:hypothetical protein